jgi:hypothetical protein
MPVLLAENGATIRLQPELRGFNCSIGRQSGARAARKCPMPGHDRSIGIDDGKFDQLTANQAFDPAVFGDRCAMPV